jgi:hypothetical protein
MSFVSFHCMYFLCSLIPFTFSSIYIEYLKAQNSSYDALGLSNLNYVIFFLDNSEFISIML